MPTITMANRVFETSTTTGTGTISLLGAPAGFQTFVAGIGNGLFCYYCIEDGVNWEVGTGQVTDGTPDTLSRTVDKSSNGNAAVNWGAGTRNVFCTFPATGLALTANNGSDLPDKALTKQNLLILPSGQSGGTDGKVVRVSAANTWTDASQADTIAQLLDLMFKAGGYYYPAGSTIAGLSGLTAGAGYFLSTAGGITSSPPTPSGSVRLVKIGTAISTTSLLFHPGLPIGG